MAGQLVPAGPPRDVMMQRMQVAGGKAVAAGMAMEQASTGMQRLLEEQAQLFKSGAYKPADLIADVDACEKRYGMPSSELHVN